MKQKKAENSLVWLYFSLPVGEVEELRLERQPGEPDHRGPCMLTKTLNYGISLGAVEEFGHYVIFKVKY